MNFNDALSMIREASDKLKKIEIVSDPDSSFLPAPSAFRDATEIEQNLLNIFTGDPEIDAEFKQVLQYCENNVDDVNSLLKLSDLLDKFGVFPHLREQTEQKIALLEQEKFEIKYLQEEYKKNEKLEQYQLSIQEDDDTDGNSTFQIRLKQERLEELELVSRNYQEKIRQKEMQKHSIEDQIEEYTEMLKDLENIIIAEEEEQLLALEEETNVLKAEIKKRKRRIEDYDTELSSLEAKEIENIASTSTSSSSLTTSHDHSSSSSSSTANTIEQTYKQLEFALNELLLTDRNNPEATHEGVLELANELKEVADKLKEQVDDTNLPSLIDEYAEKLNAIMEKLANYFGKEEEEEEEEEMTTEEELNKLQAAFPDFNMSEAQYDIPHDQKLKFIILSEVRKRDIALQELKDKLKSQNFNESMTMTTFYKLVTYGFIALDRTSRVTMVKWIFPHDS